MADLHDALAEQRARQNTPVTEIGSYQKPKPPPGVCVATISVAGLFPPNIKTLFFLGGKKSQTGSDSIPQSIADANCESLVASRNRIGGHLVRKHDLTQNRRRVDSYYSHVGVTEFISLTRKEAVVKLGVNFKAEVSPNEGPAGQGSLSVVANQESIAKLIRETPKDRPPSNKLRIETADPPGLVVLAINRTQFPHLVFCYQLWESDTKPRADLDLSLEPICGDPLTITLPTITNTLYYKIKPDSESKKIQLAEAQAIANKHKQGADLVTTPRRIQKSLLNLQSIRQVRTDRPLAIIDSWGIERPQHSVRLGCRTALNPLRENPERLRALSWLLGNKCEHFMSRRRDAKWSEFGLQSKKFGSLEE